MERGLLERSVRAASALLIGLVGMAAPPVRGVAGAAESPAGAMAAPGGLAAESETVPLEAALSALRWRPIGPAVMGGRVTDLAVVESNPAVFYVGTASGGVWKTTSHGASWEPVFDDQGTASVGDVTVAPSNPNVVWVGTGEANNRQSSPWGDGVYRSVDGGRTWQHLGLQETRHIGRIVVHPTDPDVAYVAAVGHLWGPNPERGVYRTTDGGRTWERVLYVDEDTGAVDLAMDPGDPDTLFAAMYQRRRTAWGFNGGGPGSGIYRSLDGGDTWERLTNGLPQGELGRIGLDIYRRDGSLVYAVIEADPRPAFGFRAEPSGRQGRGGVFRSTDRGETWEQLSDTNPRPMYFSQIRVDPNDPHRIYLAGVRLHVSDDGGRTFRDDGAPGVHSDHHALWIDPRDSGHLLLGSDGGVSVSFDQGRTWRMYDNLPIGQFYAIGVDMRDPYWVCGGLQDNGTWCGPSATRSVRGILNGNWVNINGGDGFYARIDPDDHTVIFAESQNGNIVRVDLTTGERTRIRPLPRPGGGEAGRRGPGAGGGERAAEEERQYRWNWNTPILVSAHDRATIYVGANVLLRSTDRGHSWDEVSPDLTKAIERSELEIMGRLPSDEMLSRHDGVSSYGNITAISESPLNPGVLYVGTDDGNLQGTRNGGADWIDLTPNLPGLPGNAAVSRVVASRFREGTVYAAFDAHANDDYGPYVYLSDDFGRTWRRIVAGLPHSPVNVIAEHPRDPDLLFIGNEVGVYVSLDRGERWVRLKNNLPTVPVDDLVVHPRDNDLVVGTHGRGIWILDDITPLEDLSAELLASPVHLFPVRQAVSFNPRSPQGWAPGAYAAPNPPYGALIRYYLREDQPAPDEASGDGAEPVVTVTILDADGRPLRQLEGPGRAGIQQVVWDLRLPPPYEPEEGRRFRFFGRPRGPRVLPGSYTARLEASGAVATTEVVVELDPLVSISDADLAARQEALMTLYRLLGPLHEASRAVRRLQEQLGGVRELLAGREEVPESLEEEVGTVASELRRTGAALERHRRGAFGLFAAVEGSTTRPTVDQQRRVEEIWQQARERLEELNRAIEERVPALYRRLDELGIRPDPGRPIELPRRPGS